MANLKVKREALSNVACEVMHRSMDEFSNVMLSPEDAVFDEMQFAIDLKRALANGSKELRIKML